MALLQILSIVATPCIAIAVAIIAWRQWETARQKLMLDLFEKRLGVLTTVEKAAMIFLAEGRAKNYEVIILLQEAKDTAHFLFGQEVAEYIKQLKSAAIQSKLASDFYDQGNPRGRDVAQEMFDAVTFIAEASENMRALLEPYLKMDQTLPGADRKTGPQFK